MSEKRHTRGPISFPSWPVKAIVAISVLVLVKSTLTEELELPVVDVVEGLEGEKYLRIFQKAISTSRRSLQYF